MSPRPDLSVLPPIVYVVGVRPNYVKVNAVLRALRGRDGPRAILVDTGQHYDPLLRDAIYADLNLGKADEFLGIGSGSHAQQTAATMIAFERTIERTRPSGIVVFGDVNSTLACALTAAKMDVPVAHVEAGLRCFDRRIPEEINRTVVDALSDLLLAPSREAVENLLREGLPPDRIHFVGNVMVDSLLEALPRALQRNVAARLGVRERGFILLTLHRPQNVDTDDALAPIVEALDRVQRDTPVVFPIHPRTAVRLRTFPAGARLLALPGVRCLPPLGYLDFICLQSQAQLVITDSGGTQEETSVMGVPCVTVLSTTERPVTVDEGTNHLVGTEPDSIVNTVRSCLVYERRKIAIEGWDGAAGSRVVDRLLNWIAEAR